MLYLPDVTLIQIDTVNTERALRAMSESLKGVRFGGGALLLQPDEVKTYEDYNRFVVKELWKYFNTSHCLLVQWDGYVINPDAWTNSFLHYDYIGAQWDDGVVGNGGFSLRSHKFCVETSYIESESYAPEDVILCRNNRVQLEHKGINFSLPAIATRFSFEHNGRHQVYSGQFGFHGTKPKV